MRSNMDLFTDPPPTQYNLTKVGWVDGPDGRGTLSLLLTCLFTLFLSAWAVMHLNVPRKDCSLASELASYFYWCFYGIFGPELVIWTAWRQLLSAWALRDELRNAKLSDRWTIAHGFYALMGGFVIDMDASIGPDSPRFANGIRTLSLTPKGILLLAKCGHLPQVTRKEIMDKSKEDEVGKAIACLQVTWMIVQVCTRLGLHLPVTTLEVTAVSHVVCALVLYALWWHKPRKIREPTVLSGDWIRPIAAFMLMCSRESQEQLLPGFQLRGGHSEIAGLTLVRIQDIGDGSMDSRPHHYNFGRKYSRVAIEPLDRPASGASKLNSTSTIHSAPSTLGHPTMGPPEQTGFGDDEFDSASKVRWQLAQQAISKYPAVRELFRAPPDEANIKFEAALESYPEMPARYHIESGLGEKDPDKAPWLECHTQHLVSVVASNWPHDGLLRTTSGLWIGASLWLVSIAYGGINIAAWHAEFPTNVEAWLWRLSSLYIAFSGVLWAALHVAAGFSARLWWTWYDLMKGDSPKWLMALTGTVCAICGTAYLFARSYLIIEAFISLRQLPVAAYLVPSWTLGVPHIA